MTSSRVSGPDVARRAARVAAQRMVAVDQPAEDQVGAEGRVFEVALQLGQRSARLAQSSASAGKAGRRTTSASSSSARGRSSARTRSEVQAGLASSEPPTSSIAAASSLGRAVLGPFLEQPAGQARNARPRLAEPAGVDVQLQGHDPGARPSLVDQAQAVVQPRAAGTVIDQPR